MARDRARTPIGTCRVRKWEGTASRPDWLATGDDGDCVYSMGASQQRRVKWFFSVVGFRPPSTRSKGEWSQCSLDRCRPCASARNCRSSGLSSSGAVPLEIEKTPAVLIECETAKQWRMATVFAATLVGQLSESTETLRFPCFLLPAHEHPASSCILHDWPATGVPGRQNSGTVARGSQPLDFRPRYLALVSL